MTQEQIRTYTLRVSQASPRELVVIMYDIILDDIQNAREAKAFQNQKQYQADLTHAGRFLNELMESLDFSVGISYQLMSLYIYAHCCWWSEIVSREPLGNPALITGKQLPQMW